MQKVMVAIISLNTILLLNTNTGVQEACYSRLPLIYKKVYVCVYKEPCGHVTRQHHLRNTSFFRPLEVFVCRHILYTLSSVFTKFIRSFLRLYGFFCEATKTPVSSVSQPLLVAVPDLHFKV